MLRAIFDGKAGEIDPAMIRIIGNVLEKQVFEGFGSDFLGIDYTTPDGPMLTRLTRDTWTFASAKNYQQLRDMTMALVSESGQARTFSEFEEAAKLINAKYNRQWLLTEYNQAVGSATMAARWNEFEKNADIMPFLRYSTVGDKRVRDSHKALDGITRKIDDDFWATYFPPNGWGCRCSVDQLPGSKQKESKTVPSVPVPDMFKTNLAVNGLIFPPGHPYYVGAPKSAVNRALLLLPDDVAYKTFSVSNGKVDAHLLHKKPTSKGMVDLFNHLGVSNDLYALGYSDAKLLPEVFQKDNHLKARFYPKNYKFVDINKNPDLLIKSPAGEKKVFEIKCLQGNGSTFSKKISEGAAQADHVIIKLLNKKHRVKRNQAAGTIMEKLGQFKTLKGVIVLNHDGSLLYESFK